MTYTPLGKFSTAAEELIFTLAFCDQWADEEGGNSGDYGLYFMAMSIEPGSLSDEALQTVDRLAMKIDADDSNLPGSVYGHWLVTEDSQGFARVVAMESAQALTAAFTELQDEFYAWDSQDEG